MFGGKHKPEYVVSEWAIEFFPDALVTTDEDIRRIVREEMAEIVSVDVPDAPPKDL